MRSPMQKRAVKAAMWVAVLGLALAVLGLMLWPYASSLGAPVLFIVPFLIFVLALLCWGLSRED